MPKIKTLLEVAVHHEQQWHTVKVDCTEYVKLRRQLPRRRGEYTFVSATRQVSVEAGSYEQAAREAAMIVIPNGETELECIG